MLDNDKVKVTDKVKKQILNELLPIAAADNYRYVNGDMKDRAQ